MTDLPDPPSYYPVSLDVSGRPCLVVGGGGVAARKARTLLDCGGEVTVIAPELSADMEALVPSLHALERRPYAVGEAAAFRLVVTATGIPEVDGAVYADAEAAGSGPTAPTMSRTPRSSCRRCTVTAPSRCPCRRAA